MGKVDIANIVIDVTSRMIFPTPRGFYNKSIQPSFFGLFFNIPKVPKKATKVCFAVDPDKRSPGFGTGDNSFWGPLGWVFDFDRIRELPKRNELLE
ncbi:MAG: hypothetical protein H0A75_02570 [Candidatus Methanofishera endochildressiae]|uniref:Uncharacterized protein n=1 Tax=Candidatus Methanofishera endochildressiae TaxID=2738884 RepID=A0A7Z0MN07_9GAMM|nr:hypothetical protein [Candidatus Methanofishera endochildressiae]